MKTPLRITLILLFCVALCLSFSFLASAEEPQASYFVYYDANGGSNVPDTQEKTAGFELILSHTVPAREEEVNYFLVTLNANGGTVSPRRVTATRVINYEFQGWNTATDGTGIIYAPGDSYTLDGSVTLYAQWKAEVEDAPVWLPTPERSNYTFKGWSSSTTATEGITGYYMPEKNETLFALWVVTSYQLTFNANGGRFPNGETTQIYTIQKGDTDLHIFIVPESSDPHSQFDYWALEDGTQIEPSNYVPESDITFYAHYAPYYRLTLDANGGYFYNDPNNITSNTTVKLGNSFDGGSYIPSNPDPHLAFSGWYYDSACTELAVRRNDTFTPEKDVMLYAGWSKGWIITLDANGGSFGGSETATRSYSVPAGSSLTSYSTPMSTDSSMQFRYWTLADGTRVDVFSFIPEEDVIFYAHYAPFYHLYLDANDGYFYNNPAYTRLHYDVFENESFYVRNIIPINPDPHLALSGWYYDSACTELAVSKNGSFTPDTDMTLYAGWSECQIVTFDANGGYFSGNPNTVVQNTTVIEGSYLDSIGSVPENSDSHLIFDGWYYDPACTEFALGQYDRILPYGDMTLYAGWSEGCIITFDANGGNFGGSETAYVISVLKGSSTYWIQIPESPDPDMVFGYWTLEDGTRTDLPYCPESDVTLYAQYVPFYNIGFHANGGYFDDGSDYIAERIGGFFSFSWPFSPSNSDPRLVFSGWYYDAACTQLAAGSSVDFIPNRDLDLYAGWNEGWVVTLDANGGKSDLGLPSVYITVAKGSTLSIYAADSPYEPPDPSMEFSHWALEDGTRVTWNYIPEGDVTLYAQYVRVYQLTLNANEGYFDNYYSPDSISYPVREGNSFRGDEILPVNSVPRLAFTGWYYDPACTELAVGRNESFTPESNLTLFAGWDEGYIVSFRANGGRGVPASQNKAPGETLRLTQSSPTRYGWYFVGWAETADAEAAIYPPNGDFSKDEDTTLYAVWKQPDFILPPRLATIEDEAFTGGAFTFVLLPDHAVSIGWHAFANCPNLKYVYIPSQTTQIDEEAFGDLQGLTILGQPGTIAETFAQDHRCTFVSTPIL